MNLSTQLHLTQDSVIPVQHERLEVGNRVHESLQDDFLLHDSIEYALVMEHCGEGYQYVLLYRCLYISTYIWYSGPQWPT